MAYNKEEYKKWLKNTYFTINTPDYLLESLTQFSKPIYIALGYSYSKKATAEINKYLKTKLEKPNKVRIERFLLYTYGFKYCNTCQKIVTLENFAILNKSWDKRQRICKSCMKKLDAERYRININNDPEFNKKLYQKNKEYNISRVKEWQNANREKVNATAAKRRAAKCNATPVWLSKEHRLQILEYYKKARELSKQKGEVYHVDHIVPLVNDKICGLHVPWNLQILPAKINISKGNKYNGI